MRIDLSMEAFSVIDSWTKDGAACACKRLDEIEDALLDESGSVTAEHKLMLIREVRTLKEELSVFIPEKGGK